MRISKLQHLLSFIVCFVMITAVSVNRDHKLFGLNLNNEESKNETVDSIVLQRILEDGTSVINTTSLGKEIIGYNGPVPLEIYLNNGKISNVQPLENIETPRFFKRAAKLLDRWTGKTPEEAVEMKVDAVSGATFTSEAIIGNVQAGMQYVINNPAKEAPQFTFSPKLIIGLIVVLMAAILPIFIVNKRYHIIQMILNVIVLGFWSSTFISYSLLVGFLSNGVNIGVYSIALVMLITAFIYPFFGRKQHYCTYIYPLGSLQQLAGKCTKHKIRLGNKTTKLLNHIRRGLWVILMLCLWSGVLFEWMDYELFAAFIFQSASTVILIITLAFILLSAVITRPYCRFVCPTGTLLKFSEGKK